MNERERMARLAGGGAMRKMLAVGLLLAAALAPVTTATAQPATEWVAPPLPGDWHDPNNWSFGVPLPAQDAIIDVVPGGWASIGLGGPAVGEANMVLVGATVPSTLEIWLGGDLDANVVHIGTLGTFTTVEDWTTRGRFVVEGLAGINGQNLGVDEGGIIEVLGGSIVDANQLTIGQHVSGTFNQLGGTVQAGEVYVGRGSLATGDAVIVDGQLEVGGQLVVGLGGSGAVTQDGGDVTSMVAVLGRGVAATGSYELNDGNFSAGAIPPPGIAAELPWSPGLWVGVDGGGLFTQNGGSAGALNVGIALTPNSVGIYEMNGGSLTVESGMILGAGIEGYGYLNEVVGGIGVGLDGNGAFVQNAGDVSAEVVSVGVGFNGRGVYRLDDGTLTVSDGGGALSEGGASASTDILPGMLLVGLDGDGLFEQSGGLVSADSVGIGVDGNGVGLYQMKGGLLQVTTGMILGAGASGVVAEGGAICVGVDGNGTFAQSGGDVLADILVVGENAGSVGAVNLLDGNMIIGEQVGPLGAGASQATPGEIVVADAGDGDLTQSGGALAASGLTIASQPTANGLVSLLGGATLLDWIALGDGNGQLIYDGGLLGSLTGGPIDLSYGTGTGDVTVHQGPLDLYYLDIHSAGDNSLHQTGGTINVGGVEIGQNGWWPRVGAALYQMTGGVLNIAGEEFIPAGEEAGASAGEMGGADLIVNSEGLFDMSDGEVNIANGSFYVGDTWGEDGQADANVSGGEINVGRDGYALDQWMFPPRGHVFVGGTGPLSEGTLEFSGGVIRASRLYIGPLGEGFEWFGEGQAGASGGHFPAPIVGPGRLYITGGTMHLDGDGDSFEAPSTIGGLLAGHGTIVSAGPIQVLSTGAIVAADGRLTVDAEVQSVGHVDVVPGAELRTHGTLDGLVTVDGTLTAYHGDMRLTGQVVDGNTSLLSNSPGTSLHVATENFTHEGSIRSCVGGAVTFVGGIVNLPGQVIDLAGGTLESPSVINTAGGLIKGQGTIIADDSGLVNMGQTDFNGTTWVYGALVNQVGAEVHVRNGDLHVTEDSINDGLIKILNGQAYFEGNLIGGGILDIDPAVAAIGEDLIITPDGVVTIDALSKLQVRGNFDNASTQRTLFDLTPGTVQFHGQGYQMLEAASEDLGPVHAGWTNNFAFGRLVAEIGSDLDIVDAHDNILDGNDNEAVYIDTLELNSGVWVRRNGRNVYYRNGAAVKILTEGDFDLSGTIDKSDLEILEDNFGQSDAGWIEGDTNGDSTVDYADYLLWKYRVGWSSPGEVPEPGTMALLAAGGLLAVWRRRKRA